MTNKFVSIAHNLSNNRYLSAIRDGFIYALPLTLTASFAILINNVLFANNLPYALANPDYYGEQFIEVINIIKFVFTSIEFGALNWITPVVLMGISYSLSEKDKAERPFVNSLIVFATFITLLPKGSLLEELSVADFLRNLGGTNLFTALIVGITFTEILLKLQKMNKLKIKLPDTVPPMVAKSFSTLFPAVITIFIAGIIAILFMIVVPFGYTDLSSFISGIIQQPFLALASTGVGGSIIFVTYTLFLHILWIFGLHGANILDGFAQSTLGVLQLSNQAMFAQTGNAFAPELATFTTGFFDAYTRYGGSGATLGLIIAIWLVSKRADYKAINKLSIASGIFNINEPIIFGLPIVLNPILAIPFVLAPLVSIILPGILTYIGWLPKIVITLPWVAPPILSAFLGTGGNWLAAIVAIINLGIMTAIYIPFVILANKQIEKKG